LQFSSKYCIAIAIHVKDIKFLCLVASGVNVNFGHQGDRHERRLIGLGNHETGLPASGHWGPSGNAAKRLQRSLKSGRSLNLALKIAALAQVGRNIA